MNPPARGNPAHRVAADGPFLAALATLSTAYLVLVVVMLVASATFTTPAQWWRCWASPEIRYAAGLSLVSSTLSALLSLWIAVPLGYLLSRGAVPGRALIDLIVDIPIVLPPLVVGLCLLILFQSPAGRWLERAVPVTYEVPAVVLAQFTVACAFAVRTMRVTFDQIDPRREQVALTLGCSRRQAFFAVVLPEAWRGVVSAGTLAWARSLGEFGPVLVFAGATRMKTEVLPTSVFLELSVGNVEAAVAVSLILVCLAMVVLLVTRALGLRPAAA